MSNLRLHNASRWCYLHHLRVSAKFFMRLNRWFNSCDIPYTAEISKTVEFAHMGLGVVIGHDTIIGPRTKIESNVTIGGRSGIRANPVIGADVLIGTGASVLGPVHIGNGAKIGAGAVVITDIPEGATAVGVPASVVSKDNDKTRN